MPIETLYKEQNKEESKNILSTDYSSNFSSTEEEYIKTQFSKKDENGTLVENISQIIRRISLGIAIARLKYTLKSFEIIQLPLEKAIESDVVLLYAAKYYDLFGKKKITLDLNFNINPETSLNVLQYEAHGELIGFNTNQIWNSEKRLKARYENLNSQDKEKVKMWVGELKSNSKQKSFSPHSVEKGKHELAMGYYASKIKRKGHLSSYGVISAGDSLEELEKATQEILDLTTCKMGIGINTSTLRPLDSLNSEKTKALGPDYLTEKIFIPLYNSLKEENIPTDKIFNETRDVNHPDITLFLEKKKPCQPPDLKSIVEALTLTIEDPLSLAEKSIETYGRALLEYNKNNDLSQSYNISIRATAGFMDAVENQEWYPAIFNKSLWTDSNYSISLKDFPEAENTAIKQELQIIKSWDNQSISTKKDGGCYFYAPDIYKKMCSLNNIRIYFADNIDEYNANKHMYEQNTPSSCGRYMLTAQGEYTVCPSIVATPNLPTEMEETITTTVDLMDDIITISHYPISSQNSTSRKERKLNIEFFNLKDFLSKENISLVDFYTEISNLCIKASKNLASQRGAYPLWQGSLYAKKNLKLRNSTLLTFASDEILEADMEFSEIFNSFSCKINDQKSPLEIGSLVLSAFKNGYTSISLPISTISEGINENNKTEFKNLFNSILEKMNHETEILERLNPQTESQEDITLKISQNLEETKITTEYKNDDKESSEMLLSNEQEKCIVRPKIRPKRLYGFNEEVITPEGSIHVHVYYDTEGPRQVFTDLASAKFKTFSQISELIEALCRMTTKALKWGCPPKDIAEGLINIQSGENTSGVEASSIPDAIGKVLLKACTEKCSVCATELAPEAYLSISESGGPTCTNCGWISK